MGPDLHGLGRIGEAEAHFLGALGLSTFLRCLYHQDLLSFFGHLLGFGKASFHARGEIEGFGEGEALLLVVK